jgi:hypothetical protein
VTRSKKKNPSKVALTGEEPIKSEALLKLKEAKDSQARDGSPQAAPSGSGSGSGTPKKTDAERRFEETQRRRVSNSMLSRSLKLTLYAPLASLATGQSFEDG